MKLWKYRNQLPDGGSEIQGNFIMELFNPINGLSLRVRLKRWGGWFGEVTVTFTNKGGACRSDLRNTFSPSNGCLKLGW